MDEQPLPLVSVIIPNWNGARHLPTCLRALETQMYPRLEVIVVDNGSTDESVELTRREFPGVAVVELAENRGLTGAINRGIERARGEIIAPLNNDTEVSPGWAAALVAALTDHPQAGMAASKMLLFDERDRIHSAGDAFGADGIPINRGVWQKDEGQFDGDTYIFGGCGGAVAYRRQMLDEIGLFDEDLFMYCEDVDLNWRAQLAGYRCVFAPEAIVYHHLSATGGGTIASFYTGRNTLLVLVKDLPGHLWRANFWKIARAQLKIALEALRAWRGAAARARLRGQLSGLWLVPRWLAKRRQVQATRRASLDYLASLLQE
ncbi:MAG: glycosyltransferase family 2 protein [Anaerolineae bacterium]